MSLIDSTKSKSCFESISVGSQIIHYIDNIANVIYYIRLVNHGDGCAILYRVIYQKKEGNWLEGRKGDGEKKEEGRRRTGEGREKRIKRQKIEMGKEGKEAGNEQGEVREMKEGREERGQEEGRQRKGLCMWLTWQELTINVQTPRV